MGWIGPGHISKILATAALLVINAFALDEEAAFLRAMRAAPQDDSVRLVYADWLDEHGRSERAQFIRHQVALARLPPGHSTHRALHWEATKLVATHPDWLPPGLRAPRRHEFEPVWERGFVTEARVSSRALGFEAIQKGISALPLLKKIKVLSSSTSFRGLTILRNLATLTNLEDVASLHFVAPTVNERPNLLRLMRLPLSNIRVLNGIHMELTGNMLRGLPNVPFFSKLIDLRLLHPDLRGVANSTQFDALETLRLERPALLLGLASRKGLPRLRRLVLERLTLDAETVDGILEFARTPEFRAIRALRLEFEGFSQNLAAGEAELLQALTEFWETQEHRLSALEVKLDHDTFPNSPKVVDVLEKNAGLFGCMSTLLTSEY